ncbi:MAG: ABC transporter permease [Gammaproteobacteria bacterium]|nr:ABC transporter permease [Gammaproteobacteria bacterium]
MDFVPIMSTLKRHKTAAALIALEIALSCAIVANAVFVIRERLDRMSQPSGIVVTELIQIELEGIGRAGSEPSTRDEDMAALRAIPGVRSVAATNQVPYGMSSWNTSVNLEPDQMQPILNGASFYGSEDLLETLGLRLVSGRGLEPDEYQQYEALVERGAEGAVPSVVITASMAGRLFPDGDAVGRTVYVWSDQPTRIVGVVEHLQRPGDYFGPSDREYSMLLPVTAPMEYGDRYVLRVDPERREEILAGAVDALLEIEPDRIVSEESTTTIEQLREEFFQQDRAMAWLLVAVCVALLAVTAAGIVGLASFWVQQRSRQIGVRRAVGATRGQILRYFQTENFLLATIGIVLGMALAYAINALLMERYELARLPWQFLPIGAVTVWLLGQLAVLGPALRASAVPPAVATRSV